MKRIHIIKGNIGKIKISNAVFPLIDINTSYGVVTAVVNASSILGSEYEESQVALVDYKVLD